MALDGGAPPPDAGLSLDGILSRVPYKEMLSNLFGGSGVVPPSVPHVTRAYEESFMREPVDPSERACAMGETCEFTKISRDPGDGFVGVEFLLPGESRAESPPHMCVLCHRKTVQTLFYDMVYSGSPCHCVIQRYGNICGPPNEYAREVTAPFASFLPLFCLFCLFFACFLPLFCLFRLFFASLLPLLPLFCLFCLFRLFCLFCLFCPLAHCPLCPLAHCLLCPLASFAPLPKLTHTCMHGGQVMLVCPPNGPCEFMPLPSVSHQRNRYRVVKHGGVRFVQQLGVSPSDFQCAPPSSTAATTAGAIHAPHLTQQPQTTAPSASDRGHSPPQVGLPP